MKRGKGRKFSVIRRHSKIEISEATEEKSKKKWDRALISNLPLTFGL
ncbi:hypothetical protein LEP1GSC017_0132 [Leptospira meyeri serovar Hardjo str. Went 5]|nr:hypothetical protein LEP1GSC017_0132 [Leptospira meyeri serovar Hardjo str. Went 5]